ncbi:TraV family lipoprotein [Yersinia ruckeri]|uniref:TraV family lipoprotein n=1 Tax=Yersinia ruckeri TaxID=29486 RepID=UPI0005384878|nr:TraV family lipoprotein [Yersinia ruckeri]AUQ43813.1 type IV conjugative transfer system protein TraV [Yersinia ruckeri]
MKLIKLSIIFPVLILSGCGILPYHNDFACKLEDGYGKCISSADAYDEAVTGINKGKEITDSGVKDDPKASAAKAASSATAANSSVAYDKYRDRVYQQLTQLIAQPQTPVVKPAKVVRTLIMSYSPSMDGSVAYMPRYVFSMLEGSQFVLTGYQLQADAQSPEFLMGAK